MSAARTVYSEDGTILKLVAPSPRVVARYRAKLKWTYVVGGFYLYRRVWELYDNGLCVKGWESIR